MGYYRRAVAPCGNLCQQCRIPRYSIHTCDISAVARGYQKPPFPLTCSIPKKRCEYSHHTDDYTTHIPKTKRRGLRQVPHWRRQRQEARDHGGEERRLHEQHQQSSTRRKEERAEGGCPRRRPRLEPHFSVRNIGMAPTDKIRMRRYQLRPGLFPRCLPTGPRERDRAGQGRTDR
jgi:hypothetical protein